MSNQELQEGIEVVHWSQVLGNPYVILPKAQMLSEEGEHILRWVGVQGEPKSKLERSPSRYIKYDKDYVVHWIAKKLGTLLHDVPRADLLKLITAAKNAQ